MVKGIKVPYFGEAQTNFHVILKILFIQPDHKGTILFSITNPNAMNFQRAYAWGEERRS